MDAELRPPATVLLVSAPWRPPNQSDLSLATIRPLLRREGIAADVLYGPLLFPRPEEPPGSGPDMAAMRAACGMFYFVPYLYPGQATPEETASAAIARLHESESLGLWPVKEAEPFSPFQVDDPAVLRPLLLADIERAGRTVEACVERAADPRYDVVGFSCTFEQQITGSLAIAARLKERRPDVRIIFGGAALVGEPAAQLAAAFPFIDAVCHGEGDRVAGPLVRTLRADGPLHDVPGIVFATADARVHRTPAPPLLADLDWLPEPDHDAFLRQHAQSAYADLPPELWFETSRGCWWGQKRLCRFCGFNADGLSYRRKSPARALAEIRGLHERYPQAPRFYGADNVLDLEYLDTVLPELAAHAPRTGSPPSGRPLRLFWEVRSNLRRDQVRTLARAGCDLLLPGIESLSDPILELMDKGGTGLGQLQLVKWLQEEGLTCRYNLIVRNPGERAEHYRQMTELVPYVEHLTPPDLVRMTLCRFSPYFSRPDEHGLCRVRPRQFYRFLYRGTPGISLAQVAYQFDYDHPMLEDNELTQALRGFARAVRAWSAGFRPHKAYFESRRNDDKRCGALLIRDGRPVYDRTARLDGLAADVYRYLDHARPAGAIGRRFRHLDATVRACLTDTWLARRWVCRDPSGRLLAVLPERCDRSGAGGSAR